MREFPNHNWLEQKYSVPSDVRISSTGRKGSIDCVCPGSTEKDTSLESHTPNTAPLAGSLSVETNLCDNNSAPLLSSNGSSSAEGSLSLRLSTDENSCSSQNELKDDAADHLKTISDNSGVDMTFRCLETVEPTADVKELKENNGDINR